MNERQRSRVKVQKSTNNQKRGTVSAPGKLMLMGEHAVIYNLPCLVTAVDQRLNAEISLLDEPVFRLEAKDVGVTNYQRLLNDLGNTDTIPKGARFVETAIKNFIESYKITDGIKVETKAEFSASFGFGSSSASAVCTVKGLAELFLIPLSEKEIFDLCYKTVLDVQGVGSGFDIAAAVYGGTLYYITGGKEIEKITDTEIPLVVGYTGVKADTPTLVRQVAELRKGQPQKVKEIFQTITKLVEEGKQCIQRRDWQSLGDLFRVNHGLLVQLGVSTEKLDNMVSAALNAGAYGAKLSGAGGGDCMIALVSESKRSDVEAAIKSAGGEIIPVQTSAKGVRKE